MQQLPPQPAYILHSRPFRDSSLILDLLTPEYGRIACIAKGARRDKQRRQRALQPFAPLLVTLLGRRDLKTLGPVESAGQPLWLKGRAVYGGLYANELLLRLLPEGESLVAVFAAYQRLLEWLAQLSGDSSSELEMPLRVFELQLLHALGSCPELGYSSIEGAPISPDSVYRLTQEDGFVPVAIPPGYLPRGADFFGRHLLAMAQLLGGEAASDEHAFPETLSAEVLMEAKRLTRLLLSPLLGNRPMKSRELFRQVYSVE
ncbi:DNA repair protein RecO [Microbulbifer agarilyticus]|uniref:DNA repair protein RecO n=1 Tax=Microbulbifer agarilyticus TaxID=260552 RepID=UPI0028F40251|nr:DNA repair protein RecO [Microbulbifer agarilyticus]